MSKTKKEADVVLKVTGLEEPRLDKFLVELYPSYSRTFFKRLINNRNILVDAHPASPHHALRMGQTVKIVWPKKILSDKTKAAPPLPFPIIYEDDSLLVINKPPHLLCHPTGWKKDGSTLVELLESKVSGDDWPDDMRPGLVHRLDRDTSGVLIFAKTPQAHAKLSKQFASRQVKKIYLALVKGSVKSKAGILECYLSRHPQKRQSFRVSSEGRLAITHFAVLKHLGEKATFLELKPLTGRTHQLRVQLSHYGHPILGDGIYGGSDKREPGIHRQMLHASKIQFTHPETAKKVEFEAPLPDDIKDALKHFE